MALPINIEDLLGGLVVEGNRVEYKKGWNPDPIYRSICAFANDFDDTCGGYIVVGVDEVDGRAVRPVEGIDINKIESIEKDMVGFNNLIIPYYQSRVFFEQVDGTAGITSGVWAIMSVSCWAVRTVPQSLHLLPSVSPFFVQVAATAGISSGVCAVISTVTVSVCVSTQLSSKTAV